MFIVALQMPSWNLKVIYDMKGSKSSNVKSLDL